MKPNRVAFLCVFLCAFHTVVAQNVPPQVRLVSGSVTPRQNINTATIDSFNKEVVASGKGVIALLQFTRLPSPETRKMLSASGIDLLSYIPQLAYTVRISRPIGLAPLVKANAFSLLKLLPQQKMDLDLAKGIVPAHAAKMSGMADVRILFPSSIPVAEVLVYLREQRLTILQTDLKAYHILHVRIPVRRLREIAASPYVEFMQAIPPPEVPLNGNSRSGARAGILNASSANGGRGLNGEGVVIGIGDNANIQLNTDFAGRLLTTGTTSLQAHGVHVSGTAAGAGIFDEQYRGYAPKAKIASEFFSNVLLRAPIYVYDYNMVLTNNSYGAFAGCNNFGMYETSAAFIDRMAFDYPYLLNIFAAGNSGTNGCAPYSPGFHTVLGGFQSAKNSISVGNTTDSGLIISGSSRGPVRDGRIKPEITAMGTNVISSWPGNTYVWNTGTSMSAPAVTGGAALLYQQYRKLHANNDPESALIKALLLNGASDRGVKGPDFTYGFGWMNLLRSAEMMDQSHFFPGTGTNGSFEANTINVPANTGQLKVMLYWHDPEASPASAAALVNDLDLEVATPASGTHLPQLLDTSASGLHLPSSMGADHINNVEQVVIDNPDPGAYTVNVRGTAIAQNPSQPYFVVYDFVPRQMKISSPAGGEAWAPTLYSYNMSKITWEADGVSTGTVLIELSTDGGASWTQLASGINLQRRLFSWWVPAMATSSAVVRITNEITAERTTSNPFTIVAAPAVSLTGVQCPGYVSVAWAPVSGVTEYEVMRLYGDDMQVIGSTSGTAFTISALSADSTYYVSVRAKLNGKAGPRSVAIARKPDNGLCTGSISDNDLQIAAIVSPLSGRAFTASEPGNSAPVRIRIQNLDDAAVTGFTVRYAVNGGAWVSESLPAATIVAGGQMVHTFGAVPNLSLLPLYTLRAEVINHTGDVVTANNTIVTQVRRLSNDPLTLDFVDDLEAAPVAAYDWDTVGLTGMDRYDFENTSSLGRMRTFVNSGLAYSGNKAFTSEATAPVTAPYSVNKVTGTFNMSGYNALASDVRLDFRYLFTEQKADLENGVWIRGNEGSPWIEIYRYHETGSAYALSQSLEIGDTLLAHGQDFSTSFQVRWNHAASAPTIYADKNFSVDDIHLYEVFNDMQLVRIDSPLNLSCGLGTSEPIKIVVHNSHNGVRSGIPVKYSVNNGPWIREVIPTIPANTSIIYTFNTRPNLSAIGAYSIRALVDDSTDSFHSNDSAFLALHNAPQVTLFPYVQDFEMGDGGFHAEGQNSTWAFGTPASPKISKAASGANAWKTNLFGDYNDFEQSFLYSPCFDLSTLSKPTLSFSVALDLEDCGAAVCDYVKIEYTTDGRVWMALNTTDADRKTNWYNKGSGIWSIEDYTRWHVATCALPVGAANVRFRFVMSSDEAVAREGIAIDDIHVYDNTKPIYDGATLSAPVTQSVQGGNWIDFEKDGKLLVSIQPQNQDLGVTEVQAYINTASVRHSALQYYHDRSITIKPSVRTPSDSVGVRLYFLDGETENLINASGCAGCSKPQSAYDLGVSKYSDADTAFENGSIGDNGTGLWSFILPGNTVKVPFDKGYYAEFKVKSFSEFWLNNGGLTGYTPLPLRLLHFTAKQPVKGMVQLEWRTENEQDMDRFEIERATGQAGATPGKFERIGSVQSKGNNVGIQDYTFSDNGMTAGAVRYYRLRMIGRDGAVTFSPTRSLVLDNASGWKVYPNPSAGVFHFIFQAGAGEVVTFQLLDAKGSVVGVYSEWGTGFPQKTIIDLGDASFAPGMYLLQVTTGPKPLSFKLYKQ